MRTTLNVDDSLLEQAARLTGVNEKATLVRLGLEALIAKESAKRLSSRGGSDKKLKAPPRRRSKRAPTTSMAKRLTRLVEQVTPENIHEEVSTGGAIGRESW